MPLGRTALRTLRGIFPVVLNVLLLGCSALPQSTRMIPRSADIRTRTHADRVSMTSAGLPPETTDISLDKKLLLNTLEDLSPLPPALPMPIPPAELPPSLPTETTNASGPPTPPPPIVDTAVRLAEIREIGPAGPPTKRAETEVVNKPEVSATPEPKAPSVTASVLSPEAAHPAPAIKTTTPEPIKPEDTWREGVQTLRAIAQERLKATDVNAKSGTPNWLIRERLLRWLGEPDVDPDGSTEEVIQGRAVLKGLEAVLDPSKAPAIRGAQIREAVATLEAKTPLEITELRLCRKVHGFGNIEPLEPIDRKSGQSVVLYCELEGLAYVPEGLAFRSRVAAEVELIADGAQTPNWVHGLGTAEDTCQRKRRDFFIGHKFTLPESLPVGKYQIRLTERDLVTNHVATRQTPLTISK